jgi:Pentapeptide repeats (9 copies)
MWASWPGKPDSIATRFAELYAQALDRLADPRAPLRVGALHTLEAISRDYPAGRSAIVDVICAYLRMSGDGDQSVRATAQLILAAHLRPGGPGFWRDVSIDLRGAPLTDLDLSGCRIDGDLTLDGAVLAGPARLRGLCVTGTTSMARVVFTDHAWLERSTFRGPVRADNATFHGDAWFGEAHFGGPSSFTGAEFAGHAWFGGCTFQAPVDLSEAVFRRSVGFRGAVVGSINLSGTTFLGPARVSRKAETWNVTAPGWAAVVDQDNGAVGHLLWVGEAYVKQPRLERQPEEQVTPV